jgi:hypothetical protein
MKKEAYPPPADNVHPFWDILVGIEIRLPFIHGTALAGTSTAVVGVLLCIGVVNVGARRFAGHGSSANGSDLGLWAALQRVKSFEELCRRRWRR